MTDVRVDSAELERQLNAVREQQRALSEVLSAAARGGGLQAVLDEVIQASARLCGGESGVLALVEADDLRVVAHSGAPELFDHDRGMVDRRDRASAIGRVALEERPVQIPDVEADPEYSWPGQRIAGYRAVLGVPITLEGELIGAMAIMRDAPGPWRDEHVELVKTFADQAAIAIQNARLLDAVNRQLDQQRAISDVLAAVARAEGLDSVLHALVEAAARLCAAQFGEVHLIEGDLLRLAVGHGGPEELYEYEASHPHPATGDRSSVNGRVVLTHEMAHIPDILEDPEYSWPAANEAGIRALLGAPLLVEGELVGVFNLVRTEAVPFTDEQIELVRTFADQAAIAVANARLIEAVERQRGELSRFVSPQVAELLTSEDGEKMLAGHRAYVSILFVDLRGFTAFVQGSEPEEMFEVLREFHVLIGRLVERFEGTLERFAGDGVMVFFNDPLPVEDHELKAIRFALDAQEEFGSLSAEWSKRGIALGLGIGIASGYATLGRIGFEGRHDYAALGTVTNLASRLSSEAAPGQTLLSQRAYAAVEDKVDAAEIGQLELKGLAPMPAYELVSLR